MRFLLDTHTLLWFLGDPDRLGSSAAEVLASPEADSVVSVASLWEVAIKWSRGKLRLDQPPKTFLLTAVRDQGLGLLPVSSLHALSVGELPFPELVNGRQHRDPFDRVLVAQCLAEGRVLLSKDAAFDGCGRKPLVWPGIA